MGDFETVTKWFYKKYMVLNSGIGHFMCLGKNTENDEYFFIDTEMENSSEENILGIII